jgi:DNA-binding beta-propeller fold protein YncE
VARQVPKVDLLLRHGAIAGRYVGLIAAVLLLALPAAAQANGALIQKEGTAGCFSWNGSLGCETSDQLSGANDAVVSPDGQNVYVVSSDNSHSITIFDRALDGSLTQKAGNPGCIRDALAPGCAEGKALFGANSVAVSPDGKSVYVSAAKDDAVAVFDRAANGTLTEKAGTAGCVSEDGTDGNSPGTCTDGKALLNPFSVEVSADGTSVYVASASSSAVAVFDRAADGSLTQKPGTAGCISESGTGGGCADGTALAGASGVAVSAAGDSVYATSLSGDSVAVFDRAGDGTLTQKAGTAGCISEDGMGGACTDGKGLWGGPVPLR